MDCVSSRFWRRHLDSSGGVHSRAGAANFVNAEQRRARRERRRLLRASAPSDFLRFPPISSAFLRFPPLPPLSSVAPRSCCLRIRRSEGIPPTMHNRSTELVSEVSIFEKID